MAKPSRAALPAVPTFHASPPTLASPPKPVKEPEPPPPSPRSAASPYRPPSWSAAAEGPWLLEVVKNSTRIEAVNLTAKAFITLGRFAEAVDVHLRHPTISRTHAVLQHRAAGGWYAMDLGSTHGTRLNRQALPPRVYHPIQAGDRLQFGRSTRIYLLSRPGASSPPAAEERQGDEDEDVEEDSQDQDARVELPEYLRNDAAFMNYQPYELAVGVEEVPARKAKALKKLQKKVEKLNHLLEESYRIRKKEDDGLSEGQLQRLAQNEMRVAQLRLDIATAEASFRPQPQHPSGKAALDATAAPPPPEAAAEVDDSDDFYDRTTKSQTRQGGRKVSRFQRAREAAASRAGGLSLFSANATEAAGREGVDPDSHEGLKLQRAALEAEEARLEARGKLLERLQGEARDADATPSDSVDAVVATSQQAERREEARDLVQQLQRLKAEKRKLDKLVEITRPALDTVGTPAPYAPSAAAATDTPASVEGSTEQEAPVAQPGPTAAVRDFDEVVRDNGTEASVRQPSRNPEKAAPIQEAAPIEERSAVAKRPRPQLKMAEPAEKRPPAKRSRAMGPSRVDPSVRAEAEASEEAEWRPPAGQTGDGRTQLNDALGY